MRHRVITVTGSWRDSPNGLCEANEHAQVQNTPFQRIRPNHFLEHEYRNTYKFGALQMVEKMPPSHSRCTTKQDASFFAKAMIVFVVANERYVSAVGCFLEIRTCVLDVLIGFVDYKCNDD